MKKIKNLSIKLDGNVKIIELLNKNVETLKKVSRFQIAIDQLNSNQKKMEELHPLLEKDITFSEKVKNINRRKLEEIAMTIIKIMHVYAYDKKQKDLQDQLKYLNSEYIQRCLDIELIKISKKIWQIANKYGGYSVTFPGKVKAALNPDNAKASVKFEKEYGLNSEMIKNIEESTIRFIESMLLYMGEMKGKNKAAREMKKINKQIKNLLTDKIDKFMLLFESKTPGFYTEYRQLREMQLQKKVKETRDQAAGLQNTLIDEGPNNQA
jgi:hypothetical protein